MSDFYVLLLPAAVFAVLILFRFAGCGFSTTLTGDDSYPDEVKKDNPVFYYRLQETGGLFTSFPPGMAPTAADEMNHKHGTYGISPSSLDDPANSANHSPTILTPSIELGVSPSIIPKEPNATAVNFYGSEVFATDTEPLGDLSKFSVEAIVRPEWVINQRGFFYCVFENSVYLPEQGAPPPPKNTGFAIFAGPQDLSNAATSPYCWQLWVGTGAEFLQRAIPAGGGPEPLVRAENTYLAVTFGDTRVFLYVYTDGADIDLISYELIRLPYLRATHLQGDISLRIGIAGRSAALLPPLPGPPGLLYPFVGRMAEVALYETVLPPDRVRAHIMAAFNT